MQVALVLLAALAGVTRGGEVAAEPPLRPPYLLVEAWFDRPYCSDLYAFDLDGKLLRRLTREPLPTCALAAASAGSGGQILFVANASALYDLSLRHNLISSIHSGNVGPVALSPAGHAVAYTTTPFAGGGQVLRVQPLIAGAAVERLEMPVPDEPTELALTPDGKHVLLTTWASGRAELIACDLTTHVRRPFLNSPTHSFYQPTFASDGKSFLAVREDRSAGEWAVVSVSWPAGDVRIVRRAGPGHLLAEPRPTQDGRYVLFTQDGILARCTPDGQNVTGLSGPLDERPRPVSPRSIEKRALPRRATLSSAPVGRYVAHVESGEPPRAGAVIVIDVLSGEKRTMILPAGKLVRAGILE
jgi:hypothetical protein